MRTLKACAFLLAPVLVRATDLSGKNTLKAPTPDTIMADVPYSPVLLIGSGNPENFLDEVLNAISGIEERTIQVKHKNAHSA